MSKAADRAGSDENKVVTATATAEPSRENGEADVLTDDVRREGTEDKEVNDVGEATVDASLPQTREQARGDRGSPEIA